MADWRELSVGKDSISKKAYEIVKHIRQKNRKNIRKQISELKDFYFADRKVLSITRTVQQNAFFGKSLEFSV